MSDILVDEAFTLDQKLTAIKWATLALYQLHRQKADWGNGIWQSISHGDATANNVVISVESASTRWIDFDTRHLVRLPDVDRRADDLRALLFSCASHLKQSCFQRLVDEFMSTNPDALVVARLRERFLSDWSKLNTHQLAQAPLTWPLANSLSQAFLIIPSAD